MYDQQAHRIQNKHTKIVFVYTSYKRVDIIEIKKNISFIKNMYKSNKTYIELVHLKLTTLKIVFKTFNK